MPLEPISEEQMAILLEFADRCRYLCFGRPPAGYDESIAYQEWKELRRDMNYAYPDDKNWKSDLEWKAYWNQLKNRTKAKVAHAKRKARLNNTPLKLKLEPYEERIMELVEIAAREAKMPRRSISVESDSTTDTIKKETESTTSQAGTPNPEPQPITESEIHRSRLHDLIRVLVISPFLLSGCSEEKQQLQVELFSDFVDDTELPVTDAYVEVQSRWVQVYSAELHVEAHFTGLRYVMFHWPKLSCVVGISTNLFFVSLIFILSWYHLQDGIPDFVKGKFGPDVKDESEDFDKDSLIKFGGKIKLEREDSSLFEEDSFLEELHGEEFKKEDLKT